MRNAERFSIHRFYGPHPDRETRTFSTRQTNLFHSVPRNLGSAKSPLVSIERSATSWPHIPHNRVLSEPASDDKCRPASRSATDVRTKLRVAPAAFPPSILLLECRPSAAALPGVA